MSPEPTRESASAPHRNGTPPERLRYRGYRGDFLPRHRALLFAPSHATKILGSIALSLAWLLLWILALDFVTGAWLSILGALRSLLGLSGFAVRVPYELFGFHFTVPYLYVTAGLPSVTTWWIGAIVTIVVVIASFLTPRSFTPAIYLLRVIAFFQITAQVFFAFWPQAFPYGASGYVHGMLIAGLFLISLVPIILGFTYYIFDFSLGRKIGLTLLMMVHLSITIPVQYLLHAFMLHHVSLLFLPLLFFIFGLPLDVMIFIGFYTWGFSWKNRLRTESVQWKVRRRFV
jgi:hypothetical protein